MSFKKRVYDVLEKNRPDQIPWGGDLSYYMEFLDRTNNMPEEYRDEAGLYKIHLDLGVGLYLQGYFPYEEKYHNGVTSKIEVDGLVRTATYSTPIGDITDIRKYSPVTYSYGPTKHFIETTQDLAVLRYVMENTEYVADYTIAAERNRRWGDDGITVCYMPKSPVMDLVALKAGILNFVTLMMDNHEELEETLKIMEDKFGEACEIVLKSPAEFIMIPENLSSEVLGATYYDKYAFPYHKKWTDKIRKAGKKSMIHMDGTVKGLLGKVSRAGFDIIEAVTPAPVGDITMWEMDEIADERVVLWGGLPGALFDESTKNEQFDAFVIDTLTKMKEKPNRFVLGVADQVPPNTKEDRIKRVRKLVDQYGKL